MELYQQNKNDLLRNLGEYIALNSYLSDEDEFALSLRGKKIEIKASEIADFILGRQDFVEKIVSHLRFIPSELRGILYHVDTNTFVVFSKGDRGEYDHFREYASLKEALTDYIKIYCEAWTYLEPEAGDVLPEEQEYFQQFLEDLGSGSESIDAYKGVVFRYPLNKFFQFLREKKRSLGFTFMRVIGGTYKDIRFKHGLDVEIYSFPKPIYFVFEKKGDLMANVQVFEDPIDALKTFLPLILNDLGISFRY